MPAHTRIARRHLSADSLLAPEHTVAVTTDPAKARWHARDFLGGPYLNWSNYVRNWMRPGYAETDIGNGGSDRLVDDLVLHGTPEAIAAGLERHFEAGADYVAIQALPQLEQGPMPGLRALARVVF